MWHTLGLVTQMVPTKRRGYNCCIYETFSTCQYSIYLSFHCLSRASTQVFGAVTFFNNVVRTVDLLKIDQERM